MKCRNGLNQNIPLGRHHRKPARVCYHLRWSHCRSVGPRSLDPSSFLLLFINFKLLLQIFLFNHLRKPTLLAVLIPFQPSGLQEQQNTFSAALRREKVQAGPKSLWGSERLWGNCKENMEPGSVSPSPSRKWHQLLLFAKALNEFPLLMGSGLPATSCSLQKELTLPCCSEKQGPDLTLPAPQWTSAAPASRADLNTAKCLLYKHTKGKVVLPLPYISPSLPCLVSLTYFTYTNYGNLFFTKHILVICWNS